MYWKDTAQDAAYRVPDDIVDLQFRVNCRKLPVDHAYALRTAIVEALPWLAGEPLAGIQMAYGAEAGSGWARPGDDGAVMHLSRRARLNLRLPKHRLEQATRLEGRTLDVGGHECAVLGSKVRLLSTHGTLFTRGLTPAAPDERTFLDDTARMLAELGVRPPKMMGGLVRVIRTPQQDIETRSLMLDGLKPREAVLVQQRGLGERRELGCGVFVPHKGVSAVREEPEE